MYIKTLTIQGFKSYRDQTATEPFSPGHNVVVGRNGSGKSNFFSAIRFVLSDAYTSMSREERQALLHEGLGTTATLSAFVEIVFDNSDNRFPTNNDEVVIRRTIGLKKDEYSLDRKSASKADVANLLESAGFSRSNPYYIVPQGRITHLTNAKDHERLGLLKEVAGTRVYEQRRLESIRIMEETDAKRAKIDDLLKYIEERLAELDEEKEELKEFYNKDKERRCLEYSIYQRELQEVIEALEEIEEERQEDIGNANRRRQEFQQREREISDMEERINADRQQRELLILEKSQVESERRERVKARTQIECIVSDLEDAGEQSAERKGALQAELRRTEQEIRAKETKLTRLQPQWEEGRRKQEEARKAYEDTKTQIDALYSKGGRAHQFHTQRDRDAFLRQEIANLRSFGDSLKARLAETEAEKTAAEDRLNAVQQSQAALMDKAEKRRDALAMLSEEWAELKTKRDDLIEQKKELWKEDAKLESTVSNDREELRTAERGLASMMDKSTSSGLKAVARIAQRLNLTGVYGPLYQLFRVQDKHKTAVEVTAGNSLFHVVVDTDDTASRILEVMNKENSGRVTFMPLNRLRSRPQNFPQDDDAIPMIKELEFDRKYIMAFEQVFGKSVICRNLEIAGAYARSHGLSGITLDGDKVDRKGALTGGYHDVRRSPLDSIRAVRAWQAKFDTDTKRLAEVKKKVVEIEQEITTLVGKMQQIELKRKQANESKTPLQEEAMWLQKESSNLKQRLANLQRMQSDLEADLRTNASKALFYEEELRTPMTDGLSAQEARLLDDLSSRHDEQKNILSDLSTQVGQLSTTKNLLDIELNENLRRRREELKSKIESLGQGMAVQGQEGQDGDDVEARRRELKSLKRLIEQLETRADEIDGELEQLASSMQELGSQLEKAQAQQQEDGRSIARQQKNVERFLAKRQMLTTRKDECNSNIRDLGVLPEEAFEKYTQVNPDKLMKQLHKVNESLKKFSHVNKKAVEQYNNFTKQRDQLIARREELDASASSIEELIEVLDQRKDEAIERTFKQVSKYFEEVFEKLVPVGRGKLIMQRRLDELDEEDEEMEERDKGTIENYIGVSIKVSFNSKVDEGLRIQQLSGGQKSLVALALVFAIQKCDPAPFYLFDEIDANLDAQYRTAVATMIHELSSNAQFITTTFRPELLTHADKFYGCLFNNAKVSSLTSISRDEAQEFVEVEAQRT